MGWMWSCGLRIIPKQIQRSTTDITKQAKQPKSQMEELSVAKPGDDHPRFGGSVSLMDTVMVIVIICNYSNPKTVKRIKKTR